MKHSLDLSYMGRYKSKRHVSSIQFNKRHVSSIQFQFSWNSSMSTVELNWGHWLEGSPTSFLQKEDNLFTKSFIIFSTNTLDFNTGFSFENNPQRYCTSLSCFFLSPALCIRKGSKALSSPCKYRNQNYTTTELPPPLSHSRWTSCRIALLKIRKCWQ